MGGLNGLFHSSFFPLRCWLAVSHFSWNFLGSKKLGHYYAVASEHLSSEVIKNNCVMINFSDALFLIQCVDHGTKSKRRLRVGAIRGGGE